MCRIAGIVNFELPFEEIEKKVKHMCDLQKHGGPDSSGIYASEEKNVVLGNRRLSLLDMSDSGQMPMQYRDRYYITYNGEIYNFKILKNELISLGHQFKNETDTEVILAGYAQWGVLVFSKLRGMYAFALWDSKERELFLVRDVMGIKPLYYGVQNENLYFASEIRAFEGIEVLSEENKSWPIFMMAYGHLPEPITTFQKIKPLHSGCFLKYSLSNKNISIQSYSHLSFSNQIESVDSAKNEHKHAIENSVKNHLIADAPIGVFLSGGLDSGVIASVASKYKETELNTLSIYFDEPEFSEKKYQDILIKKLNCKHHQLLLKEEDFHNSFESILKSMDLPSCDGINTWFISRYAKEIGLKAVLSGLGGDELYGGYPSFNRIELALLMQQMPDFLKSIGKASKSKKLNRMSYLKLDGIQGIYLFLRGHFTPHDIAHYLGAYEQEIWTILNDEPNVYSLDVVQGKNKASWMEFNLYMKNQLLRDSDVMSMIHGVEIRVPFLDEETVRLAYKTTPQIKFSGSRPKQFLIDMFKNDMPTEIWDRPKMGFSFPFSKWLSNSSFVKDKTNIDNKNLSSYYNKFINGNLHWSQLMSLIILNQRGLN